MAKKLFWLVGLWAAGVAFVGLAALAIHIVLPPGALAQPTPALVRR